jgi:nitroreductase
MMQKYPMKQYEGVTIFRVGGENYTRDDLTKMEPVCLRALFRERVHHGIEVLIYPIILGCKEMPPNLGLQAEIILDVWETRGFRDDDDDFVWGKRYLELAARMHAGQKVEINEPYPETFSEAEMTVVRKLIWGRRSIRDWIPNKPIPDEMIDQILEEGRAAPITCNLDILRFIVIKDAKDAKMVWSEVPTPMDSCVLIVICYDTRVYPTMGHNALNPHNQGYDAAAAADHMCLMAHALGLGACWLSCTKKTASKFAHRYGLVDYIKQVMHIAFGWTAIGTIKSGRMSLSAMMVTRDA